MGAKNEVVAELPLVPSNTTDIKNMTKMEFSIALFNPILIMDEAVNNNEHRIRVPYSYNMKSGLKSFEIPFTSCMYVQKVEQCVRENLFKET